MKYSSDFFSGQQEGSAASAREVVPLIVELLKPKSVVDVGCGVGTWLEVFSKLGVQKVLGIDGEYIEMIMLKISADNFLKMDVSKPIHLSQKFDLVISLEVGEHIEKRKSKTFVKSLTDLGDVVMFSAAIPFQSGTHHINEQWPDYWSDIFYTFDYIPIDCIRGSIWRNKKIKWWYRQNIMLFVKKEKLELYPNLKKRLYSKIETPLSIVHPESYLEKVNIKQRISDTLKRFMNIK